MSALVLAVDTCGPVIGAAVTDGERLAVRTERIRRGAEARLTPWIRALCAELDGDVADIVGVGVACGPGAFTGLRVGIATALGLALAQDVPVWPAMSLDHRHRVADAKPGEPVLALLDARKQRVYAALYVDGALAMGPADVPPDEALAWLEGSPFVATGEGAIVYRGQVEAARGRIGPTPDDPAAGLLARAAWLRLRAGDGVVATAVAPLYLRAPDAKPPKKGRIRPGGRSGGR